MSTDFVVGKDSFSSLEIRSGNSANGFFYFYDTTEHRLIKSFVLNISKTNIRTCCNVTFIEKEGRYTPRLVFSKRKDSDLVKEPSNSEDGRKNISSRIEINECHENFWALIDYIQTIKQVDVPRSGWAAISREDKKFLDSLELNREFVNKVLSSFSTPEAQEFLIQAKKEDVGNLYASVKQAKNKRALIEIESLMGEGVNESKLENWIKENDWVFGIEYIRRLDATRIGLHSDADLLVESLDGFVDLIELKKTSVTPLFIYDPSHHCYYPSAPLTQVVGQAIHYLGVMDDQRLNLKSEDGLNILKPRAKIVIGRSSNLSPKEKEALRKLNDTLHNVEVLTYDEITTRARRIVDNYDLPTISKD